MAVKGRKVVLLAEDDPEQRDVLQEVLEFEGYRVRVAASPGEVLAQLREGPDVVLLDLMGVASPEVMEALARDDRRPAVLLVSADPALAAVAGGLDVDGFLCKPYDLEALLGRLTELLDAPAVTRRDAGESCWAEAR
jgi:two-component system response regulator MprA